MTESAEKYMAAVKSAERDKNEAVFWRDILLVGLPEPQREYRFAAEVVGTDEPGIRERLKSAGLKDWRFDFAWPAWRLAFEVEGAPGRGRHTTTGGFIEDCRKYNEAQLLDWVVYRVPGSWCHDGKAIELLIRVMKKYGVSI